MHHCHEVAGIDNCKQLCGNVDASLSFSCHELAGISHCRQLCGNVDASLPFSCHEVAEFQDSLRGCGGCSELASNVGMKGVGFSKGGQIWPQICSTRLSF